MSRSVQKKGELRILRISWGAKNALFLERKKKLTEEGGKKKKKSTR